ncbi:hypothetical protein [Pseudorhodoplanes sinuspersici]|nr:hypothetical protein [Pseudorhodoplanes sinuspersici]
MNDRRILNGIFWSYDPAHVSLAAMLLADQGYGRWELCRDDF